MNINERVLHISESDIETIFKEWQNAYNQYDDKDSLTDLDDPNYSHDSAEYFIKLHDYIFPEKE